MDLHSFRVTNYRNVVDSGDIEIGKIAALVGQNECGKSNLLSALNGLNPLDNSKYRVDGDWPIDKWPPPKDAIVCTAQFDLAPEDIAALFDAATPTPSDGAAPAFARPDKMRITCSKGYANDLKIDLGDWSDRLVSDKAGPIIKARLPKCVLIDDYTIFNGVHSNFPDLHARLSQKQHISEEERTLLMALDLAALNLGLLVNADPNKRTFITTASSKHLTSGFVDKWKQKQVRFNIRVDAANLNIYVEDEGLQAPIPLTQRSAGFRWYVSFIWRFTHASNGEFKNCILLLDEPGIRLHHAGHADLLSFLETLSTTNAVIYTTHLATMIDQAYPERVRIMEVHDHHPRVIAGVVSKQPQPMMVIESRLGLNPEMGGLLGARQNLIVEGVDDVLILEKLSGVLRSSGEASLSDNIYLLPADGASKTPLFAAFMIGNDFDAAVLVDSDKAGTEAIKKIKDMRVSEIAATNAKQFRCMQLGDLAGAGGLDFAIEDMFPIAFYLECVNEAYRTNLTENDLPNEGSPQAVARVEAILKARGQIQSKLDKKGIMAALLRRFARFTAVGQLPAGTAEKARKVVAAINKAFVQ